MRDIKSKSFLQGKLISRRSLMLSTGIGMIFLFLAACESSPGGSDVQHLPLKPRGLTDARSPADYLLKSQKDLEDSVNAAGAESLRQIAGDVSRDSQALLPLLWSTESSAVLPSDSFSRLHGTLEKFSAVCSPTVRPGLEELILQLGRLEKLAARGERISRDDFSLLAGRLFSLVATEAKIVASSKG